jgi:hypothetical protein
MRVATNGQITDGAHGIISTSRTIGQGMDRGNWKQKTKNTFYMPINITDNKPHIMTPMTYLKDEMGLSWSSQGHTWKAVSTSPASIDNPGLIELTMSPKGLNSQS